MKGDPETAMAEIAQHYARIEGVRAVALGGSRSFGVADHESDIDLYVYVDGKVELEARRQVLRERAVGPSELDNRWFETGDEWDDASGFGVDVIYRTPEWITDRLQAVTERFEAALGYTTCLWFNVAHSRPLYDPDGWFAELQRKVGRPFPDGLRDAIVRHNAPMLSDARCSFLKQMRLAGARGDQVASNHRTAAFLASWFDVLFAVNLTLHPGEKRMLDHAIERAKRAPAGLPTISNCF